MRITKAMKAEFQRKAEELVKRYNPYKEKATRYFIDSKPTYIYNGVHYSEKEIDDAYIETATKDIERGYEERMVGYYDKWYRYSHADEGAAYDAGQRIATENPKCSTEFNIIEFNTYN